MTMYNSTMVQGSKFDHYVSPTEPRETTTEHMTNTMLPSCHTTADLGNLANL